MYYPTLKSQSSTRRTVDVFRGCNLGQRISDGEFADMRNLTSRHYPVLSPRNVRGLYTAAQAPGALIAKDALCYTDGRYFVMGENHIDMGLTSGEKQLVSMGAYVIIFPDKLYINTADITDFGPLEAQVSSASATTFTLCRPDGQSYSVTYTQSTAPEEPENQALWLDTSETPHSLKQWSEATGIWAAIASTYIRIESPGIGVPFAQYDGVEISGLADTALIDHTTGLALEDPAQLAALDGAAVIYDRGDDYIVIPGILDAAFAIDSVITVSRKVPAMDFVIESNNRLYGCRYGLNDAGEAVNEIYASKLGDFKNWNCYMGLSTDSYAVSLGSDGPFTGAVTHLGYPLFFKERCIHKLYGSYPAEFQLQTTPCRGVQPGCAKSLAIVGETLFYKARHAVCAYDGSLPVEASADLADIGCDSAVAAAHANRYYICLKTGDAAQLYVFDASRNLWHREDELNVTDICSCRDELYAIEAGTGRILALLGSGEPVEERVSWMAQTGPIGIYTPDQKTVSRLTLRMAADPGTEISVYARYDFCEDWEKLYTFHSSSLRSFSIPLRPRRCDHMYLKLEGEGGAKLFSMTQTITEGSELP